MTNELENLYRRRFAEVSQSRRAALWEVLCRVVLQRFIGADDTVVDLGAGFCEFINTIRCGRKIAVDAKPSVRELAAPGVEVVTSMSSSAAISSSTCATSPNSSTCSPTCAACSHPAGASS